MNEKILIKKNVYMSYQELSLINPSDTVLVNSDDFFKVYPMLVKIKADFPEVREIYLRYANKCFSPKGLISSDDTIALKAYEACTYFANVQGFIGSLTFRNCKKEMDEVRLYKK